MRTSPKRNNLHIFAIAALAAALYAKPAIALAADDTTPIKIGVLGDLSGPYSDIGGTGTVLAARMAVEDAGGKVLGRPVQVVSADYALNTDDAATIARKWFDTEGVDAIVDLPTTPAALAVQELAKQRHRALLVSGASSDDLTGKSCNQYTVQWSDDNSAVAKATVDAVVAEGGLSWFFLTTDYGFGHAMQATATDMIQQRGGKVIGSAVHPLGASDFSSYLLAAQASHAQVVALASVGKDAINAISQAHEFGLIAGGQRLAGFVMFTTDVHALGLDKAQGLYISTGFYFDQTPVTRAWADRFFARHGRMPTRDQADTYAVVEQYLRGVEAAGGTDAATVVSRMKSFPADYFGKPVSIRADGRVMYDMSLYQVKTPQESKGEWDLYRPIRTVPAATAFPPLDAEHCNFR